jgi:hypothetical protein
MRKRHPQERTTKSKVVLGILVQMYLRAIEIESTYIYIFIAFCILLNNKRKFCLLYIVFRFVAFNRLVFVVVFQLLFSISLSLLTVGRAHRCDRRRQTQLCFRRFKCQCQQCQCQHCECECDTAAAVSAAATQLSVRPVARTTVTNCLIIIIIIIIIVIVFIIFIVIVIVFIIVFIIIIVYIVVFLDQCGRTVPGCFTRTARGHRTAIAIAIILSVFVRFHFRSR